ALPQGREHGWDEPPADPPPDVLDELVPDLGRTFRRARAERRLLYGYAERRVTTTYLATTSGTRARHVQPAGLLDLTAKTSDHSASAWAGTGTTGRWDVAGMHDRLGRRLGWSRRRVDLPPGSYEVLLSPSCVADLMIHLYGAAGAADALGGHGPFAADPGGTGTGGTGLGVGERLTDQPLTLSGDPAAAGLECAPFLVARSSGPVVSVFDNGVPLRPTTWISGGVLTALVHTRASARQAGHPVTPWIDNLELRGEGPGRTLPEMVAATRRGLLLGSLWYLREVDPRSLLLTGLTRDGVHLVENGEIVGAVNGFRFNESPLRLLERVTEVGRTERTLPREWGDHFTRVAMPPLRIAGFTMSAVSATP
ncbi:metallopeptidase TldD-related protein, partial [Actinomadura miaoliensis]|uniref:metallopeptidase TldD-related protein n=1 Tax=Actinomadura miaoliensis TaxID=430685 RepID=UPI0031E6CAB2